MSRILIFSGTTEGRKLAELLSVNQIACVICVATEYGEYVMPELPGVTVHMGRMETQEMAAFIRDGGFDAVVDATHPFATAVSEHICQSLTGMGVPYLRLKRDTSDADGRSSCMHYFASAGACAEALEETSGNILLTTGSKELAVYCRQEQVRRRLYVRILPSVESILLCEKSGIAGKQIIAMQGPFDTAMNEALIRQFQIRQLVTKESGSAGGYREKLEAADAENIPIYVIGNPEKEKPGYSFAEVCYRLSELTHTVICNQLSLVGIGMGAERTLTLKAAQVIQQADYLFGAKRLLNSVSSEAVKRDCYLAEDILPQLDRLTGRGVNIAVLFSGDTGFYSGCSRLYEKVRERRDCRTVIYPGISSISGMSALTGISWQDAAILSIHGHEEGEAWKQKLRHALRHNGKTFLLMSGAKDMRLLGELLLSEAELASCRILAGYQLSYPEQELMTLTPKACSHITSEGLYTCLLLNEEAVRQSVCPGIPDEHFLRERVPMTKEEIREISLCKLRLREDSVVYDIGSGTGSVAVEAASRSPGIRVYAIEKKQTALELLEKNRAHFGVYHMEIIAGEAPGALKELPSPTHAFIGGSGGQLSEILELLYEKNPRMRVVINAISLETIRELAVLKSDRRISRLELVQVQVNRMKEAGEYQLMQAENPVSICSFEFRKDEGRQRQE